MQIQKRWTEREKRVLLDNYGQITYKQMELLLPGRTWFQIRNQANYLKLTGHSNLGRKYSAQKDFFSEPNLLNCYWAGFIAADGCIRGNKLAIGLASKDGHHLEKFRENICYTGRLHVEQKRVTLSISCLKIVSDLLKNFNITERKSLTLQPPNIQDESFVKAYILGLIDGDGTVTTKREGICITLYGTEQVLQWVKSYFNQWTKASNYKLSEPRKLKDRQLYSYRVSSSRASQVAKCLLSVETPRLNRKWDKFHDIPIPRF